MPTNYYIEPTFKYINFGVFVLLLIPITLIVVYNLLDKSEENDTNGFTNKYLEEESFQTEDNAYVDIKDNNKNKNKNNNSNIIDEEWDIIEYIKDIIIKIQKYIQTHYIINNENGRKTLNIRYKYNIEQI